MTWALLEYDDGDVNGAEDTQLVSFLEQPVLPLWGVCVCGTGRYDDDNNN